MFGCPSSLDLALYFAYSEQITPFVESPIDLVNVRAAVVVWSKTHPHNGTHDRISRGERERAHPPRLCERRACGRGVALMS